MQFGKPDKKSSTEGRKTYAHCPEAKKEVNYDKQFFPQNCTYGHIKRNFVNAIGTSCLEGDNYHGRRSIMNKKPIFSE